MSRTLSAAGRRVLPALPLLAVLCWVIVGAYSIIWGRHWFLDLSIYRAAGHSMVEGLDPYRLTYSVHRLPYTYTPFALFIFGPLSVIPFPALKVLWWLLTGAALTTALYVTVRESSRMGRRETIALAALIAAVCSLALEPVRSNLDYGQIDVILMGAIVVDLCRFGRWRGSLVGVAAAIKLTPLVFLLYFLVRRDWRGLANTVGTFGVSVLVAWAVLPAESSSFWFHLVFRPSRVGPVGSPSNQSWEGLLYRFGLPSIPQRWVWIALAVITAAAGAFVAARLLNSAHRIDAVFLLAVAGLLISPVSWSHEWSWTALVPVLLVARWRRHRLLDVCMALLLALAVAAPYWWAVPGGVRWLTENSLLGAGVLLVLLSLAALWTRRVTDSGVRAAPVPS